MAWCSPRGDAEAVSRFASACCSRWKRRKQRPRLLETDGRREAEPCAVSRTQTETALNPICPCAGHGWRRLRQAVPDDTFIPYRTKKVLPRSGVTYSKA
ncbi:hypothetical protein MRX96_024895 [Rhipicephalus microplus]